METQDWCLGGYTPVCLILAPNALLQKADYLRWTDALLDTVADAEPLTPIYRHNLYESWTVFFWSYLEALTEEACGQIADMVNSEVRPEDIKSKSTFDTTSQYLEKVCRETFPTSDLQDQLEAYRIVRNHCAHSAGRMVELTKTSPEGQAYVQMEHGGGFQNLSKKEKTACSQLAGIVNEGGGNPQVD